MSDLITRAEVFASTAHYGQTRRYTGEPYIEHPRMVYQLCAALSGPWALPDWALASAWLHDVVEDCEVTPEDIRTTFGPEVAGAVDALTDYTSAADGPRAARKAKQLARLVASGPEVQTIKLADLCNNATTISLYDTKFWPIYHAEMSAAVEALTKSAKPMRIMAHTFLEIWR